MKTKGFPQFVHHSFPRLSTFVEKFRGLTEGFMKLLHKTSAISFYRIHTGFQAFKNRIREELSSRTSGVNLDDVLNDDDLYSFYRNGDSADFVAASLGGSMDD